MSHGSHRSHGSHNSHGNHTNRYNPIDTGAPFDGGSHTEIWGAARDPAPFVTPYTINHNPPLNWINWSDNNIDKGTVVSDTEAKITELRDKITYLQANKGSNTTGDPDFLANNPDVSSDLNKASNDTFDNGDPIDDNQYDGIRDALETLYQSITGAGSGLPTIDAGEFILDSHWEQIKIKIDDLAAHDGTAAHANHTNSHANT